MSLSKEKTAVIEAAKAAGYSVVTTPSGTVEVLKYSAHKKPRLLAGLIVFPSGSAIDATVRLDCAKCIRSADVMRRVLGI